MRHNNSIASIPVDIGVQLGGGKGEVPQADPVRGGSPPPPEDLVQLLTLEKILLALFVDAIYIGSAFFIHSPSISIQKALNVIIYRLQY